MMRFIAILTLVLAIAHAEVSVPEFLNGVTIKFGPYDGNASVGNVSEKYSSLNKEDLEASKNANLLFGLLRRMFSVGIFTMPPLDPYADTDLKPLVLPPSSILSGKILLKAISITGAKKFKSKNLELRVKAGRTDYDVAIPNLFVNVNFRTDLYLARVIPIVLSGKLRIQLGGVKLSGALQVNPKPYFGYPHYRVTGAKVHTQAKNVEVTITSLDVEDNLLKSLQSPYGESSLNQWVKSVTSVLDKYVLNEFLTQLNQTLQGLKVDQVLAFLLPNP